MRFTVAVLSLALLGCLRAQAQEAKEEMVTVTVTKDQAVSDFLDGSTRAIGRPILYDANSQRIRGQTMGVDMTWSVPKSRQLDLVRSILAFYEVTLVPVGPSGYEVLLAVDARSTNNLVKNKATFVPFETLAHYEDRDGFFIMTSVPIRHIENLTMLRTALSTMVTPAGIGRVHEVPGANRLILMDYAPTVAAMARVIREMDVDPEPVVTQTIVLQHAQAVALVVTLKELFATEPPKLPQGIAMPFAARPSPRIAAYDPRNAIVVVATEEHLARIREVIKQLDIPPAG